MNPDDAIAWPFAIGGNVSERMEWLTDVLPPPYGTPQTRKLRQAPRTILNYDGIEEAGLRRWMETLLVANLAGKWHVPLSVDVTATTSAAAIASDVLAVDTVGRRFSIGGNAILIGSTPRQHRVVEILEVDADSLTIADGLPEAWPAGSLIAPTIGSHLMQAPTLPRFTGNSAPYSVSFRAFEPIDWAADFGDAVYRDLPVLEQPINWRNDPSFTAERLIESLDNEVGPVRLYDLAGMVLPVIRVDVTLVDRAQVAAYRSLLYALSGRWQPIWVPSYGADVAIQAVNTSTTIDIEWMAYNDWPIQPNRRDLRIQLAGAAPIYRRVTAAAGVDAGIERLQLDEALPVDFEPEAVTAISFMALCQQDADVNVMSLWSADVVESELVFRGINNDL